MAECNVSIDQKKLPGVKEVCRDFAVLEDHCLAYNLQEQEIESHLASNVHKSRLVQQDLQVAKKLQEEEDERAKIQSQKKHGDIEQQDNEIAQEIQEELVRQAEQQRQQQELQDAAIARKLQEKEKREERRRQKQLEGNNKEDYYEDHGAAQPLDLDKHTRHKSLSPGRYDSYSPVRSHQNRSPDYYSAEPKRSRYPKQDSAAPRGHSKYPEHYLVEGGRGRHADPYPDHLLPSRGKHEDRYPQFEPAHTERARDEGGRDADRVMKRKERPARPPPPKSHVERDEAWNGEKHRNDRGTDYNLDKCAEKEYRPGREWEKSRDQGPSGDRYGERERQTHKDRRQARNSEEEEVDVEGRARSRQRVHSNPFDVFDEHANDEGRGDIREVWDPHQGEAPGREHGHNHANRETAGRILHKGSGEALVETEMGLSEATKGLTKLDLREQEFKDMEVARKLQEEELKASSMHSRAQLAKDEELARRLMEQEKKEYKRNREREKEKERERAALDRMAMDKRRQEGNYRLNSEEVVRPRTRDEYDYQRQRNVNKPARPPQPRTHDYENVNPGYGYPDHLAASRPPARPEAAYKGAYNKR